MRVSYSFLFWSCMLCMCATSVSVSQEGVHACMHNYVNFIMCSLNSLLLIVIFFSPNLFSYPKFAILKEKAKSITLTFHKIFPCKSKFTERTLLRTKGLKLRKFEIVWGGINQSICKWFTVCFYAIDEKIEINSLKWTYKWRRAEIWFIVLIHHCLVIL